jgi:leucine zipper transcription factor-like protein 1
MTLDAHQLEDARVLEEMRAIERVALSRPASDFTRAALRVGMTPVEDDDDEFAFDVGKGKGKTVIVKETVVDVATARECEKLRADLAAARRDAGSRVQDSAQFQQLKRLMQQKTRELSMLRTRLRRYEPEADDGDVVGTEDDSFIEKKEEEDEEGAEVERERGDVDVAGEVAAEAAAESPRGGGVAREDDVEASPGPPPPPPPDDDDDDDDDDEFDF